MALSEEEQRLLDQMEAALAAEDPKLASALRGASSRGGHRRRAAIAGGVFLVGLACLVAGMQVGPVLSVLGFVVMLAATIVAVTAWGQAGDAAGTPPRPAGGDKPFLDRIEERWRRNQDEGL